MWNTQKKPVIFVQNATKRDITSSVTSFQKKKTPTLHWRDLPILVDECGSSHEAKKFTWTKPTTIHKEKKVEGFAEGGIRFFFLFWGKKHETETLFSHREFQQNSSLCTTKERYTADSVATPVRKFLLQSSWFEFRVELGWSVTIHCLLWSYCRYSQFTRTNRPLICDNTDVQSLSLTGISKIGTQYLHRVSRNTTMAPEVENWFENTSANGLLSGFEILFFDTASKHGLTSWSTPMRPNADEQHSFECLCLLYSQTVQFHPGLWFAVSQTVAQNTPV